MQAKGSLAFSLFMLLIGVAILGYSYVWGMEITVGDRFGPMFYPRIILWIWVLLALGLSLENILHKHGQTLRRMNIRAFVISVACVAACCAMLPYFGFLATCILFCFAYPVLLGYRKIAIAFGISTLFSLVTWYVFNNVLLIALPECLWG